MKNHNHLYKNIDTFCKRLEQEFDLIPEKRQSTLLQLKNYIQQKYKIGETSKINVICTHNSRRSHIGQIWLAVAADYYNFPQIQTFSGGTEATAFNNRVVHAFQRLGFVISTENNSSNNPIYKVKWTEAMKPYQAFSKKYSHSTNPTTNFAAILVCSEADEVCPTVLGCDFRLVLPFDDPKQFDDTEQEVDKYDERLRQIGREMMYVLSNISI